MNVQHLWRNGKPLCGHARASFHAFNTTAESNAVPVCTRCHRIAFHVKSGRAALEPPRSWTALYRLAQFWSLITFTGAALTAVAVALQALPLAWLGMAVLLVSVVLHVYESESSADHPLPTPVTLMAAVGVAGIAVGIAVGVLV